MSAIFDANLMVIADLHHSQEQDEITSNLALLVDAVLTEKPESTNWICLADLIDTNVGASGPLSANVSDIQSALSADGITLKSLADSHDIAGAITSVYDTGLYPGPQWTWNIGSKWRVLAVEMLKIYPGYTFSSAQISWLTSQLDQSAVDDRYVIVAVHEEPWKDITWTKTSKLTPSGTTGTITITSDTADTFDAEDVGEDIALFYSIVPTGDERCWGYARITAVNSGTSVTATVTQAIPATTQSDRWEWGRQMYFEPISNAPYIRSLLEGYDNVKIVLNGHMNENINHIINGIEYIQLAELRSRFGGTKTGGLLYLYKDGSFKMAGTGRNRSYYWKDFYVSNTGTSTAGGTLLADAVDLQTFKSRRLTGDNLVLASNISGDINLMGTAELLASLRAVSDGIALNGNIFGRYLDISGINMSSGKVLGMNDSIVKRMGTQL
jgi:hypothetical protein